MLQNILAVVRPTAFDGAVQAALIPTEPQAIAVYALLAWAFVVVWVGNRNSGDDTDAGDATDDEGSVTDEDEISIKPPIPGRSSREARRPRDRRKKLSRSQRRKRGHINWIQ